MEARTVSKAIHLLVADLSVSIFLTSKSGVALGGASYQLLFLASPRDNHLRAPASAGGICGVEGSGLPIGIKQKWSWP